MENRDEWVLMFFFLYFISLLLPLAYTCAIMALYALASSFLLHYLFFFYISFIHYSSWNGNNLLLGMRLTRRRNLLLRFVKRKQSISNSLDLPARSLIPRDSSAFLSLPARLFSFHWTSRRPKRENNQSSNSGEWLHACCHTPTTNSPMQRSRGGWSGFCYLRLPYK